MSNWQPTQGNSILGIERNPYRPSMTIDIVAALRGEASRDYPQALIDAMRLLADAIESHRT